MRGVDFVDVFQGTGKKMELLPKQYSQLSILGYYGPTEGLEVVATVLFFVVASCR